MTFVSRVNADREEREIFSENNPNRESDIAELNRLLPARISVTESGTLLYGEGAGMCLCFDAYNLNKVKNDLENDLQRRA